MSTKCQKTACPKALIRRQIRRLLEQVLPLLLALRPIGMSLLPRLDLAFWLLLRRRPLRIAPQGQRLVHSPWLMIRPAWVIGPLRLNMVLMAMQPKRYRLLQKHRIPIRLLLLLSSMYRLVTFLRIGEVRVNAEAVVLNVCRLPIRSLRTLAYWRKRINLHKKDGQSS